MKVLAISLLLFSTSTLAHECPKCQECPSLRALTWATMKEGGQLGREKTKELWQQFLEWREAQNAKDGER